MMHTGLPYQQEAGIAGKIGFGYLCAFLLLLPFDFFYSQLALVGFAVFTLIQCNKKMLLGFEAKPLLIIGSLYLLNWIGILYSPDKKEALSIAGRQSALILLPLLLGLHGALLRQYRNKLILVYSIGVSVVVAFLFVQAFRAALFNHLPIIAIVRPAFTNHHFTAPIGLHATYMAIFVALAFAGFACCWPFVTGWRRWLLIACMLLLLAGLLQLASRAVMVAMLVIIGFVLPYFLAPTGRRSRVMLVSLALLAVLAVGIWQIGSFKDRYINDLQVDLNSQLLQNELVEPRMERWLAGLEIVRNAPVLGHGSGAEYKLLMDKYFEKKMYSSYLNEFNAHSQYLYFLICYGIFGLLLFLFVLCWGFRAAFKARDALFVSFMVLIAVVAISENVLNLNKGVFFCSFFFSFFILVNRQYRQPPS
jgi:O-antigen ligase